jgi:hypothetical protein
MACPSGDFFTPSGGWALGQFWILDFAFWIASPYHQPPAIYSLTPES